MKRLLYFTFFISCLTFAESEHPEEHTHHEAMQHEGHGDHMKNRGKVFLLPSDCNDLEVWDSVTAMCLPYPKGQDMTHLMLHGNVFLSGIAQSGPRGDDAIASTQMLMGNLGKTFGERHYLNLGIMTTLEKWTLPQTGYPLILQTGESNHDGNPYIDHQHPHNTPIMGLTFSDTIRLGSGENKSHLKAFFSPRGQSTDGPITFMHRPTSVVQPDAPLGHHIGQDVGHITSTVIGASLRLNTTELQASVFNGSEPEPDEINLPIGTPNSGAVRLVQYFTEDFIGMASIAYVKDPHGGGHTTTAAKTYDDDETSAIRYSTSFYSKNHLFNDWQLYNSLIYGSIRTFGVDTMRHSFSYEFVVTDQHSTVFSRTEVLQRIAAELSIPSATEPLKSEWVGAFTLGYSYLLKNWGAMHLNLGASVTKSFVPTAFAAEYGGNPWSGKVFLQLSGMEMWMQ